MLYNSLAGSVRGARHYDRCIESAAFLGELRTRTLPWIPSGWERARVSPPMMPISAIFGSMSSSSKMFSLRRKACVTRFALRLPWPVLEALHDPNHPQHEEYLEWIGDSFDPDAVDADEVNRKLRRYKVRIGLPPARSPRAIPLKSHVAQTSEKCATQFKIRLTIYYPSHTQTSHTHNLDILHQCALLET